MPCLFQTPDFVRCLRLLSLINPMSEGKTDRYVIVLEEVDGKQAPSPSCSLVTAIVDISVCLSFSLGSECVSVLGTSIHVI